MVWRPVLSGGCPTHRGRPLSLYLLWDIWHRRQTPRRKSNSWSRKRVVNSKSIAVPSLTPYHRKQQCSVFTKDLFSRDLVVRRYSARCSCTKAGAFCPLLAIGHYPVVVGD